MDSTRDNLRKRPYFKGNNLQHRTFLKATTSNKAVPANLGEKGRVSWVLERLPGDRRAYLQSGQQAPLAALILPINHEAPVGPPDQELVGSLLDGEGWFEQPDRRIKVLFIDKARVKAVQARDPQVGAQFLPLGGQLGGWDFYNRQF